MEVWFFMTQDNRVIQRVETEVTAEYAKEHHPCLYEYYIKPFLDEKKKPE